MKKERRCVICKKMINIYLYSIGLNKGRYRHLISDEGVLVSNRWCCNTCYETVFSGCFFKN